MASKAIKNPLFHQISTRGFAQAAPALKREVKFQSAVLPNKTVVAAVDNGSPLTRVTVAFKAGSRYEPANELGLTHVLRSAAGLTTKSAYSYIISRKLQQLGASLSASGDREFIFYTLETTQEHILEAVEHMKSLISGQEFRPWELADNQPRLNFDIVSLSPQVRSVDLLHKAAFRRGLGNSLFVSPKKLGAISSESLQHFAATHLTADRCAIAVVGDNLDRAKLIAQGLELGSSGADTEDSAPYYGGDLRKEMGGELAHVAMALPGAAAGGAQALALAVAAKALGNGPVTKWGADRSVLARALGDLGPCAAAGLSAAYCGAGLLGGVLSVPKDEAHKAVKAMGNLLKNPSLSDAAITSGKNLLKVQLLSEAESGDLLSEGLAAQGLGSGTVRSPQDWAAAVDKISASDVKSAVAEAAKGKLSVGAAGNLSNVPYSDEL